MVSTDSIETRLERMEALLRSLVEREAVKEFYEINEFAHLIGKSEFTVREWARYRRIQATKRKSGRGPHKQWVISHDELMRYRRDGLLPLAIAK
jgi:hypothetical protein